MPEQLLKNLSEYGYETPTGIQSQGIPILLEVSLAVTHLGDEALLTLT